MPVITVRNISRLGREMSNRVREIDVDANHTMGREDHAATCVMTTIDTSTISLSIDGVVSCNVRATIYEIMTEPMAVASVASHTHMCC